MVNKLQTELLKTALGRLELLRVHPTVLIFVLGWVSKAHIKTAQGGNESFFGRNTKTDAAVEMEATYENCTGGDNSFGFVESAPASGNVAPKTVFAGTAKNCTAGSNSFASSFDVGAQAEIKAGAVIENCTAKNKSFATHIDPTHYYL